MVVSLRKMSAGHGYKYLLKTVVVGDGERDLSTPLRATTPRQARRRAAEAVTMNPSYCPPWAAASVYLQPCDATACITRPMADCSKAT